MHLSSVFMDNRVILVVTLLQSEDYNCLKEGDFGHVFVGIFSCPAHNVTSDFKC